jgi:hypothetical protein
MTRQRKLREVLNVRLDMALAREIRRIATAEGETESEVARRLLSYGAEVARRLQADDLKRHYASAEPAARHPVIEAHWRWYTQKELDDLEDREA